MAGGGIASTLIARHFGAKVFGERSVAAVYGTLVATVVEGDFGRLLMREVARNRERANAGMGGLLEAHLGLAAITIRRLCSARGSNSGRGDVGGRVHRNGASLLLVSIAGLTSAEVHH